MNKAEFETLLKQIEGGGAKLVAVSKSVDIDALKELASFGQLDFGENRVQELERKIESLARISADYSRLRWHFIGRLQSNKINALLALRPALWQSCESVDAALSVEKRLSYELPCLVQINSANESSKQGASLNEAVDIYHEICQRCKLLKPVGVMSIGANNSDESVIAKSFEDTYKVFESLQKHGAKICSMGMSDDWHIALKCGSNMLRLGRILW
ncbi:MAG: YggS family pyridoxal phosphate-dependent enzyme [Campylobacter sp.]|uniref:YggS family pyridoxal phosphate-dependent enzyme n=1 Tax=Campylobacter sp. TaxID=205 RepID=UPI002A8C9BD2|nr:YggS family pyridoxal phosphate-dependent enzyme [Campylobacter sp.]MCI7076764.1 YggS family pyridoxal phosphate-dependent enzyme [Campylobacter sp.]MDY4829656.1 YggS family pyridoxal phosphate-dependent enzyme [Campylobacter sp.]